MKDISEYIEEIRPIGVVEDNPEYIHALEKQTMIEKKIETLSNIISDVKIFEKNMCRENTVSFGATVTFENCNNNLEKKYTIVSIYESDVNKGLISNQSPFAQSMMGLHIGDIFDFNDVEYEITDISYSLID